MYSLIYDCLVKLRFLPGVKARFLQEVKCLADEISRAPKRSYTEVAHGTTENCDDACLPAGKKMRYSGGGEALV